MNQSFSIVQSLFDTQAIRVAPANQPFWYTSGTLGPYYINTHFLYGSEKAANDLLNLIEKAVKTPTELVALLTPVIMDQYQQNMIFKGVIDQLLSQMEDLQFDYISGGERRDYFFSIPVAALLNKPHLTLLKDGQAFLSDPQTLASHLVQPQELKGSVAVHLADLVTEASSYTRAWLPALERCGITIHETTVVVDRDQGGQEVLQDSGVRLIALTQINQELFQKAQQAGLIDSHQAGSIELFTRDPHLYMTEFLVKHPDFLAEQIAAGGKSEERARRCLEQGYGKI